MAKYALTKAIEGAIDECKVYGSSGRTSIDYNTGVSAQWQTFGDFDVIVVNIIRNNSYISIRVDETRIKA